MWPICFSLLFLCCTLHAIDLKNENGKSDIPAFILSFLYIDVSGMTPNDLRTMFGNIKSNVVL